MNEPAVASSANPRFRRIRSLIHSARERRREGATVLEGVHLVDAWLTHQPARRGPAEHQNPTESKGAAQPRGRTEPPDQTEARDRTLELVVAQTGRRSAEVEDILARAGVVPLVLQDRLFDSLGTMPSPAPLLAVVPTPKPPLPASIEEDTVVLDRIQDPGNVGAILRSAAAAGIARVVTTPQTAWCWSPKVLRAATGAHFALSIHESHPWPELEPLLRVAVAGALAHGGVCLFEADLTAQSVWVFGNEGDGLAAAIERRLEWRLTIPQASAVESLNVAAAAAVCLFEQRRQRLAGCPAETGSGAMTTSGTGSKTAPGTASTPAPTG